MQGQYGVLFIPETGPATRMGVNADAPYYRGQDGEAYQGGPSPGMMAAGPGGLAAARARRGTDEKYWRDGSPGAGGAGGAVGAGGAMDDGSGSPGTPGMGAGVIYGVDESGDPSRRGSVGGAYIYGADDRSDPGRSARGDTVRGPGGTVTYVGAGDEEETDAEQLGKADHRGGGGAKRVIGDADSDQGPIGWTTKGGITKRKKPKKREKDGSMDTPLRSQKELYIDYDLLAEVE